MALDYFPPTSGEVRVWYCRNLRCRRILKTEPHHALPYGCKCIPARDVPALW